MNRVYIKTYGCQMNERDSEAVAAMLRGKGYSMVESEAEADVILLNTCSVRDQAEQKALLEGDRLERAVRGKRELVERLSNRATRERFDEVEEIFNGE